MIRALLGFALLAFAQLASACCNHSPQSAPREIPVEVSAVKLDSHLTPVVILQETAGTRQLPIWIGFAEARSIAVEMEEGFEAPRPNTHDLAKRVIQGLDGEVERVVVTELRNSTYYAVLMLRVQGNSVAIDARPSDAIAIALRMGAPIFVREPLFELAADSLEPEDAGQQI